MIRVLLPLLMAACAQSQDEPVSVILMIGDGMGTSQVTLAQIFQKEPLALDTIETVGLVRTHSADMLVTDSAASATAMACGVKTDNFMIGVTPDGKPAESILETLKQRGYKVGLVTTSRVTHATPAAFGAHVASRDMEKEVAEQFAALELDVLLGGGGKYVKADVTTAAQLAAFKGDRLVGIFDRSHLPYVLDRGADVPSLAAMTRKALDTFGDDPFFVMIEGARIDQACHAYDAVSSIHEMRDFDAAVRVALDVAAARKNVLVVITADHTTGGLAITEKVTHRKAHFDKVKASAQGIADRVEKAKDRRAALLDELKRNAGIDDATDAELAEVLKHYEGEPPHYEAGNRVGELISRRIGVTFIPNDYRAIPPDSVHGHDGTMVPIYAFGPGAEKFAGTMDNTDIPKRILGR